MSKKSVGLMSRTVEAEILDDLPESDPRAVASRKDLRRLNLLMAQDRIMAKMLSVHLASPPRRILEIGSGDGSFMLAVARRLYRSWPTVHLMLLDRQALVSQQCIENFQALGWKVTVVQDDIFNWTRSAGPERFDAITTNLFLHHFRDADLAGLLDSMARLAPVFLATEPLRTRFPLLASRMLRVIGANEVTRHDAPASVRAGFKGRELSELWPANNHSILIEHRSGLFTHSFAALSRDNPS
jgi:SAM-dependent methyltransferase